MNEVKEKQPRSRKDRIKNIAIIFLVILLVLTFFSNTIMNYSLPEVSAQYPQATSITTKVRGSGTVSAAHSYDVTLSESRVVTAVNVSVGDTVTEGQTLLSLDASESEELATARSNYNSLKLEYDKMVLAQENPTASGEGTDTSDTAATSVEDAQAAVDEAQADLTDAQNYETYLKTYTDAETSAKSAVTSATQAVATAEAKVSSLQAQIDNVENSNQAYLTAKQKLEAATTNLANQQSALQSALDTAQAKVDAAETDLSTAEANLAAARTALENAGIDPDSEEGQEALKTENAAVAEAQETLEEAQAELSSVSANLTAAVQAVEDAQAEVDRIYSEQIAPTVSSLTQSLTAAQQAVQDANVTAAAAEANYTAATDAKTAFQEANSNVKTVDEAQSALDTAEDALTAAQTAAASASSTQDYNDSVAQLELDAKKTELDEAESKLKSLEESSAAASVVSRYAGVVTAVNIAAGDTTTADETLIEVELTQEGYTLTSSVTKAQAATLREGITAEVTNSYEDISMTLTSIMPSKENPTTERVLTFAVTGDDVTVGSTLNYSIGDKNASYDTVIPSAAIHQDGDGNFVYVVSVKSSPLGNRYSVAKKSVTVLASDDTNSAVSGELTNSDFVITTSATALEEGMQIRIKE